MSYSISDFTTTDKYLRLIKAFESRLIQLEKNNVTGYDYLDIERELNRFENDYKTLVNLEQLETSYQKAYKNLVQKYGWSAKDHLSKRGIKKNVYINNGGTFINKYMKMLAAQYKKGNNSLWAFKLRQECKEATEKGWYIIFNTLTINDENYEQVFKRGSKHWRNYIQNFARSIKGKHKYFACTELGEKHGRKHIHVLHFCETIPTKWKDPNEGRYKPDKREIKRIKQLWNYGRSAPIAVRTNPQDPYGNIGWRWPCKPNGQTLEASSIYQVGAYVAKYVTKAYTKEKNQWRTKASRNFGTTPIHNKLRMMSNQDLLKMVYLSKEDLVYRGSEVIPHNLLKKVAIKIFHSRIGYRLNLRRLKGSLKRKEQLPLLMRSLIQKIQHHNSRNSGNSQNLNLISELYKEQLEVANEAFYEALDRLRQIFYEKTGSGRTLVGTTSLYPT